jgi:hypothetical protein
MHRSGTSALAGALEAMGFEVGPNDDVMPADVGNPEGYFELMSIVRANDELLAHLGGRWDSPPKFAPGWTEDEVSLEFVETSRTALTGLFSSTHYVLKDPRISILLPLWRRITNDKGCAVVIVRDPLEVAASLSKRNDLPTLTGLALWADYNQTMLRDLKGARVHVCSYAELIANPDGVLTDIVASLQAWGELSHDKGLAAAIASIHPELRRSSIATTERESPPEVDELMKRILDQRGRHDVFDLGATQPIWWAGPLLEERRRLLQWALARIAELETHSSNLLTENEIFRQRSDASALEADQLRERVEHLERLSRLVPGPLRRAASKFSH